MAESLDPRLEAKLQALEERAEELSASLADPDVMSDMERFRTLSRSYSEVEAVVAKYREHRRLDGDLAGARELA